MLMISTHATGSISRPYLTDSIYDQFVNLVGWMEIFVILRRLFNRIVGKYKSHQIASKSMISYIRYLCGERIILYVIMESDSHEKQANESSQQQRDRHHYVSIEHHSKRGANAGD